MWSFGGLLVPFADEIDQCVVDVFRVRCAEEMLSAVHDDQVGCRCVLEQLDFLLGVVDRVYRIVGSLDV